MINLKLHLDVGKSNGIMDLTITDHNGKAYEIDNVNYGHDMLVLVGYGIVIHLIIGAIILVRQWKANRIEEEMVADEEEEQAHQDEVVGRVRQRALVTPLADVQADVPEEAEQGADDRRDEHPDG